MTQILYSKKHLLKAMKAAKLPYTYVTLLKYEKLGLIPVPRTPTDDGGRGWRFYTEGEIKKAVERVKEYVANQK
jgi:hypothetical protein